MPKIVAGEICLKKAVVIACTQNSSMALLDCGEVYTWGYNNYGTLEIGTTQTQLYPCRVDLNVVIRKIACGFSHSLALCDKGVLYAWGYNGNGELGIGHTTQQFKPIRVKFAAEIGKIVEIAATLHNNISAALSNYGKVYIWGHCKGQQPTILAPTETIYQSIQDVFVFIATISETSKPCSTNAKINPIINSLSLAFNDETSSDLKFIVGEKTIFVHKEILKIRCEHFRSMFQGNWDENTRNQLEMNQFTYPVYFAFLRYLYTSEINDSTEDAIGLLELANYYCEIDLKKICERLIFNKITVENFATCYSAAIKYNAKEMELDLFSFAVDHLNAVIQTESFAALEDSIAKSFIIKAAQQGAFK